MADVRLYISRHGKTMFNTIGRVQGWCDTPLTKKGEEGEYYGRRKIIHSPSWINNV